MDGRWNGLILGVDHKQDGIHSQGPTPPPPAFSVAKRNKKKEEKEEKKSV